LLLLAGPGTLTTVMLLMSESLMLILSVVRYFTSDVTWFIVRQASRIDKFIGAEGAVIVTQLLGFFC